MFETSAMKELHEIRERIYEKTKNMTRQEFIEYIRKKSRESGRRDEKDERE